MGKITRRMFLKIAAVIGLSLIVKPAKTAPLDDPWIFGDGRFPMIFSETPSAKRSDKNLYIPVLPNT